MSTLKIAVLKQ